MVGALFVAATLPISLRQHLYAPYSLIEPALLLLGLHWLYHRRVALAGTLGLLATLNRETGFLLGLAVLVDGLRLRDRHQIGTGLLALGVSLAISIGLRVWLGAAPDSIVLAERVGNQHQPGGIDGRDDQRVLIRRRPGLV